ncbi:organic hydroperoxide resistance protein [Zavarzinia sp. CC-PAN008]|uniref:organic hydroperoxide resistance protein n=1 Tax=Zavarzinia sp. CC-PAN008 TaxID=3243332 RepID=UPI003F742890
MTALYTAEATTHGGRNGHVESSDGLLKLDLAMPKAMGGTGKGTNPEQLFAAGYAACFESALRFVAQQKKVAIKDASVHSTVGIRQNGKGGFALDVALEVTVSGVAQAEAEALVAEAHEVCPYSNATRGNIDVGLSVRTA